MEATQLIGFIAAVFITAANIPQAYVIIREKSTSHISPVTYGMLFFGGAMWVVYGMLNHDWPIIICNGISTLTSLTILSLHFTSQKALNRIHASILPKKIKEKAKNSKG